MTAPPSLTIGSPDKPRVVLTITEYLGATRTARVQATVHGVTAQELTQLLEDRVAAPGQAIYLHHTGYRLFKLNGREVSEHRLVMERLLGRELRPWETHALAALKGSSNGHGGRSRIGEWARSPEGRETMRQSAKRRWAKMSPAQRRATIAKMSEARHGKR